MGNMCALAFTSLRATAAVLGVVFALLTSELSLADEGGAGVALPGSFGSLAAVPDTPGWSMAFVYYHATGAFNVGIGNATDKTDFGYGALTYAFKQPVLGGQLALSVVGGYGRERFAVAGIGEDARYGFDDLLPVATLRWNAGVNNYLVYAQGEIPTGTYNPARLANGGIGHGGVDSGGGYTYFDVKTGYEFSAVAGLTYNLKDPYTNYQNGIDSHIDLGASKFLSKDFHIGLVGYYYQ
jgi:hypothetical protein